MASMCSFFSARPVDTVEFYDVCKKYDVTPFHVEEFCINRYKHKDTGEIYYIENHCQCAVNDRCDVCFDFAILELYHNPNHYKCRVCARLERFYMAQCEFWYRYKDTITKNPKNEYEFVVQRDWSTPFGGLPEVLFDDLELLLDTPQKVIKNMELYQTNCVCLTHLSVLYSNTYISLTGSKGDNLHQP